MSLQQQCTSYVSTGRRCKNKAQKHLKCCGVHMRLHMKQMGGKITSNDILTRIVSIGYEFESGFLSPILQDPSTTKWKPSQKPIILHQLTDVNLGNIETILDIDTIPSNENTSLTRLDDFYHKYGNYSMISGGMGDPYPILFEGDPRLSQMTQYFGDTEFHVTFKNLTPSHSIIKDTLNYSIQYLMQIFGQSSLEVKSYYAKFDNNIVHGKPVTLVTPNIYDNLKFINTELISSALDGIRFFTQMTIGVKLENIVDVIVYLSKDTADFPKMMKVMSIINQIRSHVSPELCGWMFLLFLNILPNDIFTKFDYSFSLRHSLMDIFVTLDPTDQEKGMNLLTQISQRLGHHHTGNQYGTIGGLIETIIINMKDPTTKTKTHLYKYENHIVLIEYRRFSIELSQLFGTNYQLGLTLNQLSELVRIGM